MLGKSLKYYIKAELRTKSVDNFVDKKKKSFISTIKIEFLLV